MTEIDKNEHTVFVGSKPFMNYVTAVVMQFTVKGAEKVVVRSRGKFISRAVDIAEVVRNRFLKDQIVVGNIEIGSEEFKNNEGRMVNVSTLDVHLEKTHNSPVESPINLSKPKSESEVKGAPDEGTKPIAE